MHELSIIIINLYTIVYCSIFHLFIDLFIQVIGVSSDAEQLVAWLIDHPNLQPPDVSKPAAAASDDSIQEITNTNQETDEVSDTSSSGEDDEDFDEDELDDVDPAELNAAAVLNLCKYMSICIITTVTSYYGYEFP